MSKIVIRMQFCDAVGKCEVPKVPSECVAGNPAASGTGPAPSAPMKTILITFSVVDCRTPE